MVALDLCSRKSRCNHFHQSDVHTLLQPATATALDEALDQTTDLLLIILTHVKLTSVLNEEPFPTKDKCAKRKRQQ